MRDVEDELGQSNDWGQPSDDGPPERVRFNPAYVGDRHFYRVVLWSLAVAALLALAGAIVLAAWGKSVPQAIIAIGATAIGALAGIVAGNAK